MNKKQIEEKMQHFMKLRLSKEGTINAMMDMQLIRYDKDAKKVILAFPISAWQLNPVGLLHGGMICTALDIAMGCAAYVFSDAQFTPTIQISLNYVKGIKENDVLIVEGICDHVGSRIVATRALAIIQGEDSVAASANGSYAINKCHAQVK